MKTIGIDISKLTFDLWSEELGHMKFDSYTQGFLAFLELFVQRRLLRDGSHWKLPLSTRQHTV